MIKDVYIQNGNVYCGTRQLTVKDQRGRKYVHFGGRQVNIKSIPEKKAEPDAVFDYVFGGGHATHPCPAMSYWIMRHRMKQRISISDFKRKYFK